MGKKKRTISPSSDDPRLKDASRFQDPRHNWMYRFPIAKLRDPDYGRIEVILEPLIKRGRIGELLLQFVQHRIPELEGLFRIPMPQSDKYTPIITLSHSAPVATSFFSGLWAVRPCAEHRSLSFSSYPPDGVVALRVSTFTSAICVWYESDGLDKR